MGLRTRSQQPERGWSVRTWTKAAWLRLRGGRLSPWRAASSVGAGLFIGMQPWFGLHLPLCLAVGLLFRLDTVVCYAAANISNPVLAPFIIAAEVHVGRRVATRLSWSLPSVSALPNGFERVLSEGAVGAVVLGAGVALVGAAIAGAIASLVERRHVGSPKIGPTVARYRECPLAHRSYVAWKMRLDPVYPVLAEAHFLRGDVLDVGCGRGQASLFLLDLERATTVKGFDWDQAKIDVARMASGNPADYWVGDLTNEPLPAADTILLLDVLHYLPIQTQDALLARVACALRPGGHLVLRDVEQAQGLRGSLTRLLERLGVRSGVNRAGALHFRDVSQTLTKLRDCGLVEQPTAAFMDQGLANRLVIARKDQGDGTFR